MGVGLPGAMQLVRGSGNAAMWNSVGGGGQNYGSPYPQMAMIPSFYQQSPNMAMGLSGLNMGLGLFGAYQAQQQHKDALQSYRDRYSEATKFGQSRRQDVNIAMRQAQAQASQQLTSRGMGQSTIRGNLPMAMESRKQRELTRVEDQMALMRMNALAGIGQAQAQRPSPITPISQAAAASAPYFMQQPAHPYFNPRQGSPYQPLRGF